MSVSDKELLIKPSEKEVILLPVPFSPEGDLYPTEYTFGVDEEGDTVLSTLEERFPHMDGYNSTFRNIFIYPRGSIIYSEGTWGEQFYLIQGSVHIDYQDGIVHLEVNKLCDIESWNNRTIVNNIEIELQRIDEKILKNVLYP